MSRREGAPTPSRRAYNRPPWPLSPQPSRPPRGRGSRLLPSASMPSELGRGSWLAVVTALLAGYLRGVVDQVVSRVMDVLWAFPVVILGVALGTALSVGGLKLGPINIQSGSIAIPILIIGLVYVPYIARPLRGQVFSLREKE